MYSVEVSAEGVVTDDLGRVSKCPWSEVRAVSVHKLDLIDSKRLVLVIDTPAGEHLGFDEQFQGFEEAVIELAARLPGFPSDWRERAAALKPHDPVPELWRSPEPGAQA